jgi:hypothetical protein
VEKTKTLQNCHSALTATLLISAFGSIAVGCLPTGTSAVARYNITNYSPNTDSTGFAGTWVITLNNEKIPVQAETQLYQRHLVRIKSINGAPDSYEFSYCNGDAAATRSIVVASGQTITLPIITGGDFSISTNGHMTSTLTYGDDTVTLRAVRLSSNPDLSAGSVGFDLANDSSGAFMQPAVCFSEYQRVVPQQQIANYYLLNGAGENVSGHTTIDLVDYFLQGHRITGADGVHQVEGLVTDNGTLTSDNHGLRGNIQTAGNSATTAGSIVLDVKL